MKNPSPLDLILENVQIVDVFRLRKVLGWVGIRNGHFIYVEGGKVPTNLEATELLDLEGKLIAPGLIDAHMHIESSLMPPGRFAEAVLPHGTTTVLADPHEMANVAGEDGVRWMIHASQRLPLHIFYAIPSCVPSTSQELEWTHDVFDRHTIDRLAAEPLVIALGEVMDYQGMLAENSRLQHIVEAASERGLLIEGHIPDLTGTNLSLYLSSGIGSNHTLLTPAKLLEQLSKGVAVMLQYKSLSTQNIDIIKNLPDRSRILLVTDDVEPALLVKGHLSWVLQAAIDAGMPPLEAISSATIRPAIYLHLSGFGAIAPGYQADFLVLKSLINFPPEAVYVGGRSVAHEGALTTEISPITPLMPIATTIPGPFVVDDFRLTQTLPDCSQVIANVVTVINTTNTLTELEPVPVKIQAGHVVFQPQDNLALVAVFARDGSSHNVGIIKNTGLKTGAYASSFAHDSHNLLVIGRTPQAMATAATAVHQLKGGIVISRDDNVLTQLPLPIEGILSDASLEDIVRDHTAIEGALRELGVKHQRPFLLFSIMSLAVSPKFKFTDRGIVDVNHRCILPSYSNCRTAK